MRMFGLRCHVVMVTGVRATGRRASWRHDAAEDFWGGLERCWQGGTQCTSFSTPPTPPTPPRVCVCFVMHDLFAPNYIPQQHKCCFSPPPPLDLKRCSRLCGVWVHVSVSACACVRARVSGGHNDIPTLGATPPPRVSRGALHSCPGEL